MVEFVKAALPFVLIGICLAIICVNYRKGRKADVDTKGGNTEDDYTGNYLTEGMCIGMCLGISFSAALHFNMGLGITLGMLVGEAVGLLIKKER